MDVVGLTGIGKSKLTEQLLEREECPGRELCVECFWWVDNGGQCGGCDDDYQQRCIKRVCNYSCYGCSGGRYAATPGSCGRTVVLWPAWHDRFKKILEYPIADYAPGPLQIQCRLIPVLYPEVRKFRVPEKFPQIDAWAVPIHKAAGVRGRFFSNDMKDYLGVPADRKLILNTCAADNYQETLWEKGPEMRYEDHGMDYWFPGHFSIYDHDSKLYQFISAKRQQIHAFWTKSQFVWFRLGENIPLEFLNPIRKAPSVLISTNQMYKKENIDIMLNEVKIADSWFPPDTAFFIAGSHRLLSLPSGRKSFEINTDWLVRSIRGWDIVSRKRSPLKKDELFVHNLTEVLKNVS